MVGFLPLLQTIRKAIGSARSFVLMQVTSLEDAGFRQIASRMRVAPLPHARFHMHYNPACIPAVLLATARFAHVTRTYSSSTPELYIVIRSDR